LIYLKGLKEKLFLKKRTKKLYLVRTRQIRGLKSSYAQLEEMKVFCFFSSEKRMLS